MQLYNYYYIAVGIFSDVKFITLRSDLYPVTIALKKTNDSGYGADKPTNDTVYPGKTQAVVHI